MIESRQQPASIYFIISTEGQVVIPKDIQSNIVKAFSLEEALASLKVKYPTSNYFSLGNCTLDQLFKGCDIKLSSINGVSSKEVKKVDTIKQKQDIYKNILDDLKKASSVMFKGEEKKIFDKAIKKLTIKK